MTEPNSAGLEMQRTIALAKTLYATYCCSVGGKAYNGDSLPCATDFFSDSTKAVQVKAWIDTAAAARAILQTSAD